MCKITLHFLFVIAGKINAVQEDMRSVYHLYLV